LEQLALDGLTSFAYVTVSTLVQNGT